MLFHCPYTFLFTQSPARSFSSKDSCTFCCWACNFSKSHTGFLFCTLMILYSLVQIFATSILWSEHRVSSCENMCLHCVSVILSSSNNVWRNSLFSWNLIWWTLWPHILTLFNILVILAPLLVGNYIWLTRSHAVIFLLRCRFY
jgi:hypothetical protein